MSKEFIPYELAVKLKAIGFDEPYYFATYLDSSNLIPREEEDGWDLSKGIIAPLFQQAFRWFRDNGIDYSIIPMRIDGWNQYQYIIFTIDEVVETGFDTYEEAELDCLTKLIEIVQGGQDNE